MNAEHLPNHGAAGWDLQALTLPRDQLICWQLVSTPHWHVYRFHSRRNMHDHAPVSLPEELTYRATPLDGEARELVIER